MKSITQEKIFSFILLFSWFIFTIMNLTSIESTVYIIFWGILILIALPFWFQKRIQLIFSKIQFLWFIFTCYTFLITFVNKNLGTKLIYKGKLILGNIQFYILPFIAIYLLVKISDKKYFCRIFKNFLAFCSLLGIWELITKEQFYKFLISSEEALNNFNIYGNVNLPNYRTTLFFYHPIYYGMIMCIFTTLLLYFPYKNKLINGLFLFLGIVNVFLTQARSAWLILLIIFLLFLLKNSKTKDKKIKKYLYVILGLICGLVCVDLLLVLIRLLRLQVSTVLTDRLLGLLNGDLTTAGARLANWNLLFFRDNNFIKWCGGGDNYALTLLQLHPQIQDWTNAIDNQYLTFMLNYGYIGLLIVVITIISVAINLFKIKNLQTFSIYLLIFIIFIGGFFFEFYGQNSLYIIFLIMICFTNKYDIN